MLEAMQPGRWRTTRGCLVVMVLFGVLLFQARQGRSSPLVCLSNFQVDRPGTCRPPAGGPPINHWQDRSQIAHTKIRPLLAV